MLGTKIFVLSLIMLISIVYLINNDDEADGIRKLMNLDLERIKLLNFMLMSAVSFFFLGVVLIGVGI